jgi:hypothetical protein
MIENTPRAIAHQLEAAAQSGRLGDWIEHDQTRDHAVALLVRLGELPQDVTGSV